MNRFNAIYSFVYPLMRLHLCYPCFSNAEAFPVTFRSVLVAIQNSNEMLMHPIPAVLKQAYGVGSLATLKGGYGSAYRGKRTANTSA